MLELALRLLHIQIYNIYLASRQVSLWSISHPNTFCCRSRKEMPSTDNILAHLDFMRQLCKNISCEWNYGYFFHCSHSRLESFLLVSILAPCTSVSWKLLCHFSIDGASMQLNCSFRHQAYYLGPCKATST